ncbi:MAG: hypothetical protein R3B09_01135 [Nannocystaceae bacterium]
MTLLARRRPALVALALVAAAALACADDEDPTLDAEAIRARCLAEAPPAPATAITGGRWQSGACDQGPCDRRLVVESICVTYETRSAAGEILQLNHGTLTEVGRQRGIQAAAALVGVDLAEVRGACDPEGPCEVRRVTLTRDGEGSSHEVRGDADDEALADAFEHLEALRRALDACEGAAEVVVAGHCERG